MIEYQRSSWWRTVMAFHGTVLPHVLGRVGLLTAFALALCILDVLVLQRVGASMPALDQLGHTVLGVALSMLIVFRTNSSNSRYWDGRAHWGGIVNASRNLARLGASYAPPAQQLANLITAYTIAIRENLRGTRDYQPLAKLIPVDLVARATAANNPPSVIAGEISRWIRQARIDDRIDSFQQVAMEQMLSTLVDHQGGCERIQRTPLPFVYAALIKQILLVYLGTLPFVLVAKMGFAAPLVVAVVSFGMMGIEEAGIEIEDPFNLDANNLPLEQICATIARDTAMLCADPQTT